MKNKKYYLIAAKEKTLGKDTIYLYNKVIDEHPLSYIAKWNDNNVTTIVLFAMEITEEEFKKYDEEISNEIYV